MNKNDFKHIHIKIIKFPQMTFLYFSKKEDAYYIIVDSQDGTKFYALTNDFKCSMDIFTTVYYQLKCEHRISEKTYHLLQVV